MHRAPLVTCSVLLALACGRPAPAPDPAADAASPGVEGVASPSAEETLASYRAAVDAALARTLAAPHTEEEKALLQADLEFAAQAREVGAPEAFARHLRPDGKTFPAGEPPAIGPDAVRRSLHGAGKDWWWAPVEVQVSGDLGVTWGVAAIGFTGPDGKADAVQTRYVTAWRRGADGSWKVWLDMGNRGPGLEAPPAR